MTTTSMNSKVIELDKAQVRLMEYYKCSFVARSIQQIKVYRCLANKCKRIKTVLENFDRKIINKRLITKLTNEMGENNHYFFKINHSGSLIILNISMPKDRGFNDEDGTFGGYISEDNVNISLEYEEANLVSNGNRLSYKKTEEDIDKTIITLEKTSDNLQDCIDNFEKYYVETLNLEAKIHEYQDKIPYQLRKNIRILGWNCM